MSSAARALSPSIQIVVDVLEGPAKGTRAAVHESKWTIGRGPENSMVIAQDIKVSRSHVEIRTQSAQVFAKNLNPKNAMLVDGNLTVEAILKPGSMIQIGDSVIRFQFEQPVLQNQLRPVAGAGVAKRSSLPGNAAGYGNADVFRSPAPAEIPLLSHPKFRFYALVVIIGLGGLWLFNEAPSNKKPERIRDSVAVTPDLGTSESEVKRIQDERKHFETPQYKLAQAAYIKGFRDYQQGQYGRAMEAFQSARAFYPQHELALKYWTLSKRRLDEQVQSYMIIGRRYRGTQNYRLCQSSFATVIMLVKDDKNPIYQEARQFHDECRLKVGGG